MRRLERPALNLHHHHEKNRTYVLRLQQTYRPSMPEAPKIATFRPASDARPPGPTSSGLRSTMRGITGVVARDRVTVVETAARTVAERAASIVVEYDHLYPTRKQTPGAKQNESGKRESRIGVFVRISVHLSYVYTYQRWE